MARIYDMLPFKDKIIESFETTNGLSWTSMTNSLRFLGFGSCKFVYTGAAVSSYWEIDDEEYTLFLLRFS